jgi:hypothetical protein
MLIETPGSGTGISELPTPHIVGTKKQRGQAVISENYMMKFLNEAY